MSQSRSSPVIRLTFLTILIVVASARAGAGVAVERDCSPSWIFCGGEALDLDLNGPFGLPGASIDSGEGTGRFGLYCQSADTNVCFLYTAEWADGDWNVRWVEYIPHARHVLMHGSGNLGVYDADWSLLWETGTTTNETDAYLNVHDDGCTTIWHEDSSGILWSSCG
jgi:hypothetical protein